jgi:mRNA-degrading endonuclease YafQ of YafQ-DinJ toxin-antitoxin module
MKEKSFVYDKSFSRQLKKIIKNNEELEHKVFTVLDILKIDIFEPSLFTHRLSGPLKKYYSARITFTLRVLFYFDDDYIYLIDIGDHDNVY